MKNNPVEITTIIGRGAVCDGDFTACDSARIDGQINGSVKVDGNLVLGASSRVEGSVTAKAVTIGGEVYGDVVAPDKTELTGTAKVIGDITTAVIVIDEKAIFQGKCNMNHEITSKRQKLSSKTLRAGRKSAKAAIVEALKEVEEMQMTEENSQEETSQQA